MWAEQAVFTSSKTRRGEGYHLVARSPGITSDIAVALTRWCPSHAALRSPDVDSDSLNFHRLHGDTLAISRTTYGLKEFSGRGGLQIVTTAIVIRRDQFGGYENHAIRFARVARALGHLRWKPHFPEQLPAIEMPDREESESMIQRESSATTSADLQDAIRSLRKGKRVALVTNSLTQDLGSVINGLTTEERMKCHFTTGLRPSKQRPFQLQVFRSITDKMNWQLESNQIQVVRLRSPASA